MGLPCEALIDTGAARSLISGKCWRRIAPPDLQKHPTPVVLQTVSGASLQTSGEIEVEVEDFGLCVLIICPELSTDVIIGSDVLNWTGCTIHYDKRIMLTGKQVRLPLRIEAHELVQVPPSPS
jgi:hypothetical protein